MRLQGMIGKGLPQVGQKAGKEMLELLQGISGAFRPGILTCLMVSNQVPAMCLQAVQVHLLEQPKHKSQIAFTAWCPKFMLDHEQGRLQGVSGAGKTTLMDVLSGRKTGVLTYHCLSVCMIWWWLCMPASRSC